MTPTPIVPNGKLVVEYTVQTLVHRCEMRVNINNPSGSAPFQVDSHTASPVVWTDIADEWVTVAQPLFETATTITQAFLYHLVSGAYVLLDTYSIGLPGTASGAAFLALQTTATLKDTLNKTVKVVLFETAIVGAPNKYEYGALGPGGWKSFWGDFFDNIPGHLGNYFTGRSGAVVFRPVNLVFALNRKIRRRRGLV